jgi:outer membrane protein assembly factor BamD (BamD/ComL family)
MAKAQPIIVLILCLVLFGLAFAQEKPDQPSEPAPTQPSSSPQQQPQGNQPPQTARPMFLMGLVIYPDGSPADISAKVELWCDGRVRRQVHTINGQFSLTVGGSGPQDASFDASVGLEEPFGSPSSGAGGFGGAVPGGFGQSGQSRQAMNPGYMDLTGCELQASQTGFQGESLPLTHRRPMDNPDVGVLILYRAGSIAGTTSSVTTMSAPKKARKGYKKALKEVKKKKKANYEKAVVELEKATELYPEFSEAWNLLGQVRLQLKDESGAQKAFESAAASDPKYLKPQVAMMELESRRQSWDQVSQWSAKIIELHPYLTSAQYYRGVASLNMSRLEQAEESLTKVRTGHKANDYPYAGYLLGLMEADKGNFEAAAKELNHFLKLRPKAPEGDRVKALLSDWQEKNLIKGAHKN